MTDPTLHQLAYGAATCDDFSQYPEAELTQIKKLLVRDTPFFQKHCSGDHTRIGVGNFKELPDGAISFSARHPVWCSMRQVWGEGVMINIRITKDSPAAHQPMMGLM